MKKENNGIPKYLKYVALGCSALLIGLDQLFKYLAIVYLSNDILTLPIIEDFFHLTYIENRGAAFNILEGKKIFLVGLTSLIILAGIVVILLDKVKSRFLIWTASLIIGGGIGNLIDRIFRGYVVDYLDFRIIDFAVFNFADACVVVGTIMFAIYIFIIEVRNEKQQKAEKLAAEAEIKADADGE